MNPFERAISTSDAYMREITATADMRQCYNDIVVSQASTLFAAFSENKLAKSSLTRALALKLTDSNTLFRGLMIQVHANFENYIRLYISAVIAQKFESKETYSEIEEEVRHEHLIHVAKIILKIKSGSISGSNYDFDTLLRNLGSCLTNRSKFALNSEVFTVLMGNCTPDRLENLFNALKLRAPFDVITGKNKSLKIWSGETSPARVASRTRQELGRQIDLRNDIVHGNITRAVSLTDLQISLQFFQALISALDEMAREQL
jgi:RiboL-PSP-HEPN